MRRHDQRAGAGGFGVLNVGSGVDEDSGGLDIPVARDEEQWCRAAVCHPEIAGGVGVARRVLKLVPHV